MVSLLPGVGILPGGFLLGSQGSRDLDAAIGQARQNDKLLVVVLVERDRRGASPFELLLRQPEWAEAVRSHFHMTVAADKHPSVAARFGATKFPLLVLVDGDGREVSRFEGDQSLEALARQVQCVLEATERFRDSDARLKADPESVDALYWVGRYRWSRGERFQAVECFEQAALLTREKRKHLAPGLEADALCHVGEHHLDLKRFAEAESSFRQALQREPTPMTAARATLGLSSSLRRQDRLREAAAELEQHAALGNLALMDQVLFTLAYLQHEIGNRAEAARQFRDCAERFPLTVYGQRAARRTQVRSVLRPGSTGGDGSTARVLEAARPVSASAATGAATLSGSNPLGVEIR
ncbi:MAG TPA: tetratricopeptide repeat protein [Planctomycetota bacterium]|nr:tetratricopeptide repeat protein [Planctomycetota bacterium]